MSSRNFGRALLAAGALCCGTASAADWVFAPRIEVGGTYNDNYSLAVAPDEDEVAGGVLHAQLSFHRAMPRSEFSVTPRVYATLFPDDSEEESTDLFLATDWAYRTQRTELLLRGDYANESVLRSELVGAIPDGGLGEPVGGDAGRVTLRNDRELIWLRPAFTFAWSPRSRLEIEAQLRDVSFDRNVALQQVDYRDVSGAVGLAFKTSPRSEWVVRVTSSRFEPDTVDSSDTNRHGAELEWNVNSSQRTRFYVRGGVRRAEFEGATSADDTGFVGGIGAQWRWELTRAMVDLLRSVEPSSLGRVVNREEARFRLERDISPRFSLLGRLRAIRTDTSFQAGPVATVADRKYLVAEVGFDWRIRRQYSITGGYDYRWQEFEIDADNADSQGIRLSVVYEPQRRD